MNNGLRKRKPQSDTAFLSASFRVVEPSECLMIGNDVGEDALAATAAGMDAYIVTDCLIPSKDGREWNGNNGSFAEMIEMLNNL